MRHAFGGKVAGRSFGVSVREPSGFNIVRLAGELREIHERLAGVTVPGGAFLWLCHLLNVDIDLPMEGLEGILQLIEP